VLSTKGRLVSRAARVVIVLLIFGPLLLESAGDILETFGVRSDKVWVPFFHGAFWYQFVVKAGRRKPRDRYVRLVTLVQSREPREIFDNMCRQRLFMGKLLRKIEQSEPAVIVIDKFFSPSSCPNLDDEGNQEFLQSLRDTRIPIIVGLRTSDPEQLAIQSELTGSEKKALQKANLVLEPVLQFGAGGNVKYGLIRAHRDARRVPLQWAAYNERADLEAGKPPHTLPTLSQLSARAFDPTVFTEPTLKELLSENKHPFTSFLAENEIITFSAIQLVCDPSIPQPSNWEDCRPGTLGDDLFRNHVVIIGNRTGDDFYPSVIGTVPGVVLQANYVESLLDGRYLKPVNLAFALFINALLVVLIARMFYKAILSGAISPDLALAGSLLVIFFGWALVYLVALHLGYYLVIWFPGVIALVAIWAHSRAHEQLRADPENKQN